MKNLRQVFPGIIIALASIGLVFGGFSLSLTEGNITTSLTSTPTFTPTYPPTLPPYIPLIDSPTPPPTLIHTLIHTLTHTLTPTRTHTRTPSPPPSPTNCPPPVGWLSYNVQSGDTLDKIATHYRISVAALQQANCLLPKGLLPGLVIYVPPVPTHIPVSCGRPYSWIVYIVQPGDTLYHLSQAYGISVVELQNANCMSNSTILHVGQILYVPPWAAYTPSPTIPPMATPTNTPTLTPEISLPSDTPTDTPTEAPTETPIPSDTPTEVPTETPTPSCSC